MNILILIIVLFVGIALGVNFSRRKSLFSNSRELENGHGESLIARQSKEKTENKEKILNFLRENERIQNNDVERLAQVSNATAERYLDELEKEGKLVQHGKIGQSVFYTLK